MPIEKAKLDIEDPPPITIHERKPLQAPWWEIYEDVYDGFCTWEAMFKHKYSKVEFHLIPPLKKYRPKVVAQQDEKDNPEMLLHFRIRTIRWKQGYYSRIFLPDRWL